MNPSSRHHSPDPSLVLGLGAFPMRLIRAVGSGPFGLLRLTALLITVPALLGIWLVHGVALLLDEIWFPDYRATPVREPLFIVGLPRSGTSALHEALADDARHTTLRLWHLILAPAICQRRVIGRLMAMDRGLGGALRRTKEGLERTAFGFMDEVHPLRFDAPEEDYLLLAPVFACFLLVIPFPRSERVWSLTRIDDWPRRSRHALAAVYGSMVRRHLYDAPTGARLLSKNPMFTPFVRTLTEAFPDARVIGCVRHPTSVVPSLLSSLEGGAHLFGWDPAEPRDRDRFLAMLIEMGDRMLGYERDAALRFSFLVLRDVRRDLLASVEAIYDGFDWPLDPSLRAALAERVAEARSHSSGHSYSLADYGLDAGMVETRFRALMTRFQFDAS